MSDIPLHYHWSYTQRDRDFWCEHFESWLPSHIVDAHTHITDPSSPAGADDGRDAAAILGE